MVDGTIRFIYSYENSIVVSAFGDEIQRANPTLALDHIRGGSQAIEFEGGWLAVCHEVALAEQRRHYIHRFAWFDAATALSRLSEPFKLSEDQIEFVAGLARHPERDTLILSYGVADRESWLASVPIAEVRRLLGLTAMNADENQPAL